MTTNLPIRRLLIFLVGLLFLINPIKAQEYTRKSLSIMMLHYADSKPFTSDYYDRLYVPKRFDHNYIGINALAINSYFSNAESVTETDIRNIISSQQIPNKILRSILVDETKGYMTTQVIEDRGLYNATDADYATAQSSARGLSVLKDVGVKLMQNIYFLVIVPKEVSSIYIDQTQSNEYTFSGTGYLFQLDLNEAYLANQFWQDFYFDKPNSAMMNKLMSYDFPLKSTANYFGVKVSDVNVADKVGSGLISTLNTLSGNNNNSNNYTVTRKSIDEIRREAIDKIIEDCLYSITSAEDFNVKSSIFSTNPVRAKLGTKESLKPNDLFRVVERRVNEKTQEIELKKRGYVRTQWVAYNEGTGAGRSAASSFYRIATPKLDKGMLLEEAKDSDHKWTMGFSYNHDSTSIMGGYYMNFEKLTSSLPGFSYTIDAGVNPSLYSKTVELDGTVVPGYFKGWAFNTGLSLRQSFTYNWVGLTPVAGTYLSFVGLNDGTVVNSEGTLLNSSEMSSLYGANLGITLGLLGGADLTINLNHYIQLRAGIRYNADFSPLFFDLNNFGSSSTDTSGSVWNESTGTYESTSSSSSKTFEYTPKFGNRYYTVGIRLFNL